MQTYSNVVFACIIGFIFILKVSCLFGMISFNLQSKSSLINQISYVKAYSSVDTSLELDSRELFDWLQNNEPAYETKRNPLWMKNRRPFIQALRGSTNSKRNALWVKDRKPSSKRVSESSESGTSSNHLENNTKRNPLWMKNRKQQTGQI